jgi:hypothetical protein
MSQAERDNADRAAALEDFNRENASPWFTGGRLAGNVIGTYPVGGAISAPLRAAGAGVGPLADALATGGFRTGLAPTSLAGRAGNVALRAIGGAGTGGASAGLIDPNTAGMGALIGGFLPPGLQASSPDLRWRCSWHPALGHASSGAGCRLGAARWRLLGRGTCPWCAPRSRSRARASCPSSRPSRRS